MSDDIKAVEYVAEIRQVKTMTDHTVNVTFNLPEHCATQSAWFLQHQGDMIQGVSVLQGLTDGPEQIEQRTAVDPLGVVGG